MQWLEDALDIRDAVLMNNDVEDARVSAPTHVDVLKNVHIILHVEIIHLLWVG